MSEWKPIESAPKDEKLLLGWFATYDGQWQQTVDLAHCTRGGWMHGQATHWLPLPQGPRNED